MRWPGKMWPARPREGGESAIDQSLRHCEEQSDEAIQISAHELGLLRFARNDE